MSSTLKQRIAHSLTIKQNIHNRECTVELLNQFKDLFDQAAEKLFKGKHNIETYGSSIVASTNKRQLVLRVDDSEVSLEKQMFTAAGCKSFITKGRQEVTAKLQSLIEKE